MYTYEHKKRVLYGETDQMGYLYYGNYCLLYEAGRTESIRALGVSYKFLEEQMKVMMPVLAVSSRYLKPIKYDELITIRTILREKPGKLIVFDHEIYNENGNQGHRAEVKLVFVDMESQKRVSTPDYLNDKLAVYFD